MMRMLLLLMVGAGAARADELDVDKWLAARGLPTDAFDWQNAMCSETVVGPRHEDALRCDEDRLETRAIPGADVPANRDVIHTVLRVVRGKKLIALLDVPIKTFSMDAPPPHPTTAPRPPWHPFEVATDGMSITVGDPGDAEACKKLAPLPAATDEEKIWSTLRMDLEGSICKARGRYVWAAGGFRKR